MHRIMHAGTRHRPRREVHITPPQRSQRYVAMNEHSLYFLSLRSCLCVCVCVCVCVCPKIRRKTAKKEKFESPLLNSKITRNQLVSGKLYEFPYIFENSDVVSVLLSTIA